MAITFAAPAAAYIDPGSGSFALQALVAGLLGGLYAIKAFGWKIKEKLFGKPKSESGPNAE